MIYRVILSVILFLLLNIYIRLSIESFLPFNHDDQIKKLIDRQMELERQEYIEQKHIELLEKKKKEKIYSETSIKTIEENIDAFNKYYENMPKCSKEQINDNIKCNSIKQEEYCDNSIGCAYDSEKKICSSADPKCTGISGRDFILLEK